MVKLGGRCAERAGYEKENTALAPGNGTESYLNVVSF